MEFSESAKANAVKFLKEFTASGAVPGSGNDSEVDLPVRMNWPSVSDEEVEGECLDMAKGYLARRQAAKSVTMLISPYPWLLNIVALDIINPDDLNTDCRMNLHRPTSFGSCVCTCSVCVHAQCVYVPCGV